MLYRVLCLALSCAASGNAAAIVPTEPAGALPDVSVALPAVLYGFRYTADDVQHPMNASGGHMMWDASGLGCVDGGQWEDPLPGGKFDLRSPVFCIPQPCAGLLSQEELGREVYGRPLKDDEYEVYLDRLYEQCGSLPETAFDDAELLLEDYMRLASFQLVSTAHDDLYSFADPTMLIAMAAAPDSAGRPSYQPVDYRSSLVRADLLTPSGRTNYPAFGMPHRRDGAASRGGLGNRSLRGGGGGGRSRSDGPEAPGPTFTTVFTPSPAQPPGTQGNTPGGPNSPQPEPGQPFVPPASPDGGSDTPQPSPVPLAGGLPLLVSALGAFVVARRRSR